MSLFWFILIPLLVALVSYISSHRWMMYLIIVVQGFMFIMGIVNFIDVRNNGTRFENIGNYASGIGITLRSDLFGSVMVLLTLFIFSCLLIYNYHKEYMNYLFLFLFLILQGLLCGLFLSNDLFNIYVLSEVSTIVVSILIIFKKDSKSIYNGIVYFLTNLASMSLFLLGIGYIYKIFGTLDITLLEEGIKTYDTPGQLVIPFVLLITAVDLKASIMPLFSWLPKAHVTGSAPSIISAVLSGLSVKTGVYLFIRFYTLFTPAFGPLPIFIVLGFMTAFLGFNLAFSQTNIKLILAYHTISQIGLIVFGIAIGTNYSFWGAIYHITNHAIFKITLFLTAGIIVDHYKTTNIREIRGVFKTMPIVSIASIFAIFGITGAPLFNGSFSKYMIEKGAVDVPLLEVALLIINFGTILSFVKYASMFFGKSRIRIKTRWNQVLIISLLSSICFLGGVFGSVFINILFKQHLSISFDSYVHKFVVYFINLTIAFLFYRFVYHRITFFKKIREFELSFNQIVMSIIIFYSGFLFYMMSQYG